LENEESTDARTGSKSGTVGVIGHGKGYTGLEQDIRLQQRHGNEYQVTKWQGHHPDINLSDQRIHFLPKQRHLNTIINPS
jgi:hypothetical protein